MTGREWHSQYARPKTHWGTPQVSFAAAPIPPRVAHQGQPPQPPASNLGHQGSPPHNRPPDTYNRPPDTYNRPPDTYIRPPDNPDSSQYGKFSAAVPLLKWSGIGQSTTLPLQLTSWRTSAPAGAVRQMPKISGKWLCFKFCTEGLSCRVLSGRQCMFTHVDLSQPRTWNRDTLQPITEFLTKPDVRPLGLSLTPAGVRAIAQPPS